MAWAGDLRSQVREEFRKAQRRRGAAAPEGEDVPERVDGRERLKAPLMETSREQSTCVNSNAVRQRRRIVRAA